MADDAEWLLKYQAERSDATFNAMGTLTGLEIVS